MKSTAVAARQSTAFPQVNSTELPQDAAEKRTKVECAEKQVARLWSAGELPCIPYRPNLARDLGDPLAAILLQQLIYWTPMATEPDGWVYKSAKEWEAETALSYKTQLRCRQILLDKKLIEERHEYENHRLLFRIVAANVRELWVKLGGTCPKGNYPQGVPTQRETTPLPERQGVVAQRETTPCPMGREYFPNGNSDNRKQEITQEITSEITQENTQHQNTPGGACVASEHTRCAPSAACGGESNPNPSVEVDDGTATVPESRWTLLRSLAEEWCGVAWDDSGDDWTERKVPIEWNAAAHAAMREFGVLTENWCDDDVRDWLRAWANETQDCYAMQPTRLFRYVLQRLRDDDGYEVSERHPPHRAKAVRYLSEDDVPQNCIAIRDEQGRIIDFDFDIPF